MIKILNSRGNKIRGPRNGVAYHACITPKGYRRIWHPESGRLRMEHDVVWEKHFGHIPEGMEIHHKDENKLNNHISNLQLVDDVTQKRLHSDCVMKDGQWHKRCHQCKEMKPVSRYYKIYGKWIQSICKECQISNSVQNKINRRNRKKLEG